MTPALRHVADPWVPWQWWGMPDGAAERAHAVASAATQEPDRWEWIVLGGQNVVALYLAGFRDEATARRWGEQHGWTREDGR